MASSSFPSLSAALRQVAAFIQERWQAEAERVLTSAGERRAYIAGITIDSVVDTADGVRITFSNTYPGATRIEQGWAAYHLPDRINWGSTPGARQAADGSYYLIIPFRHYSAQRGSRAAAGSATARRNMLPRGAYAVAQRLQPGQYLTAGESRGPAVHAPGLHPYVPAFAPNRLASTGTPLQERLIRSTRHPRATYMTFRTITSRSLGWWIPGQPARPIAATVAREVGPEVSKLLAAAAAQDVAHLLAVTVGTAPAR